MKTKRKVKSKSKPSRYILAVPPRPPISAMGKRDLQLRVEKLESLLREVIQERDGIYGEFCRDREAFVRLGMTGDELDDLMKHGVRGKQMLAELDALLMEGNDD